MWWLAWTCLILTTLTWLQWRWKNRRLLHMARALPGPPAWPGIGNAWEFMCRPDELVGVLKGQMQKYGDVFRIWLGPDMNVVVSDPDDVKTLLSSTKTLVKGQQYKYMADVLGTGILSGSGPIWRRDRKLATPNYGKRAVESYGSTFNREVDHLLKKFRNIRPGTETDIYSYIVKCTSYSVCQTLMGLSREETLQLPHLQDLIDETPRLYDIVFERMTKWWLQIDPLFWLTDYYKDQNKFKSNLLKFSAKILEHRIQHLTTLDDTRKTDLMNSEEDVGSNTQLSVIDRFIFSNKLTRTELLNETFTIFTSSQEASAKMSSFLLMMMAYHPEYQKKLHAEIVSVLGDEDRDITDDDLKKMTYLDMVFKEVIRLFPVGTILQRTLLEDFELRNLLLPAGCSLVIPIYHLQRDTRFYTDPESFNPDRFTPENIRLRHPCCYIPFSLGPMDCLGRHFGIKLVKTICARVIREFELTSLETYNDMRLSIAISASPLNGFRAILRPRKFK